MSPAIDTAVETDHQLAVRLATDAGRLLLDVRREFADAEQKVRKEARHGFSADD